jgi:hypothetical protein
MRVINKLRVGALAGFAVLFMAAGTAQAAPSYCVPGPNEDGLSTSDVSFRNTNSDDCYGVVSGNNTTTELDAIWGSKYGGGTFGAVVGDGGTAVSYLGLSWSLSADTGSSTGDWTLSITDPGTPSLPVTVDIAVVLKAGNEWATYFFNDETFTIIGDSIGAFTINFLNTGGQFPNLSHMDVYLRQGGSGGGSTQTVVPEPASLLLLGTGLSAAAWRARRKRQAQVAS